MHTHDVRAAARALNGDVSGRDGVVCPGPGHSPQDRSLSVRFDPNAPDGFVVHSFAGDDPIICKDHVRERLGIEAFKPNGKLRAADSNAKPAISSRGVRIVATYVYTEPYGAPLYRVCRLASKKFIQERADGRGGWLPGLNGQRTVPYRWPELANYPDARSSSARARKMRIASPVSGHVQRRSLAAPSGPRKRSRLSRADIA